MWGLNAVLAAEETHACLTWIDGLLVALTFAAAIWIGWKKL